MRFPVTIALYVLSVTIVGAAQSIQHKGIRPYPAHLFVDVLAKVGYVEYTATAIEMRIHQICSEAFKYGQRDLSLINIHKRPPLDSQNNF